MTVYCVMNGGGALIAIFRDRDDAELEAAQQRKYGWYVVERRVY